jgi:hypothetical protein
LAVSFATRHHFAVLLPLNVDNGRILQPGNGYFLPQKRSFCGRNRNFQPLQYFSVIGLIVAKYKLEG